jgi:RNA 2',3'-cyclic 3'-phosphodiesterase
MFHVRGLCRDRSRWGDIPTMTYQFSLPGFEPGSPSPSQSWQQRMDVFFAIYPPDNIAASLDACTTQLKKQNRLEGKPLGRRRYHATLCPIGVHSDLPQEVLDAVARAADMIAAAPFDVAFDRVESFPRRQGKRPMVLLGDDGVAGLVVFQRLLETALRKIGFPQWVTRPYNPHVTLLYDEQEIPRQTVEPVRWTVREFALVRSLIGRGQHVRLNQWQLRG